MDDRETIELDISDKDFMTIARMAHERDITFNAMVEVLLRDYIDNKSDD